MSNAFASMPEEIRRHMRVRQELLSTPEGREQLQREEAEAEERTRQARAEQERKRLLEKSSAAFDRAEVPKRLVRVLGGEIRETGSLEAVRGWLATPAEESWSMLLFGSVGAGKSVAAAWWLRQSQARRKAWVHVAEIVRMGMFGDGIDEMWDAGALVIDDIGVEYADKKGAFIALLDAVIEKRCADERKTLITTNLHPGDLVRRYGERVVDRLRLGRIYGDAGSSMRAPDQKSP